MIEEAGVAAGSIASPVAIAIAPPPTAAGFKERPLPTPAPKAPNRIYSARELGRRAEDPGPYHNFPGSFDELIYNQGTRTVTQGFWRTPKPGLSNDSVQYRLPGSINGREGMFEIFVRPSISGKTEVVVHRFFQPGE
jgi:hypothetical protein